MPKLTKRKIDSISHPPAGQVFVRDDSLPGFALRVTPGAKSFILEKRIHGRVRRLTLGAYGPLTVDQARKKAGRELRKVDDSMDPLKVRKEDRQRSHQARTVADLCDAFIDRHAKVAKKTWRSDQSRINKYIKPRLGYIRVEEVNVRNIDSRLEVRVQYVVLRSQQREVAEFSRGV